MLALALALLGAAPASAAAGEPRVTIAMVDPGSDAEAIARALPGAVPGTLSAGLGSVSASQTYLDIGQGSRLFTSLYPEILTPLYVTGNRVPARLWSKVLERAEDAPAELDPGLLASTLRDAGIRIAARPLAGSPALIAVDAQGRVERANECEPGVCSGVTVAAVGLADLSDLASRVHGDDLLIAIEKAPPGRGLLGIGIYGEGFSEGVLTSPTTRMDGYVLSTDLLPTILARYGVEIPDDVTGREIETAGDESDAAAVVSRERRLVSLPDRRGPVLGVGILAWVALTLAATALWRRRGAALGLTLLAVSLAYIPAVLLLAAALEPSLLTERLLVGIGAPLAAVATLAALRRPLGERAPFGAFAAAAVVSVGATAIDVLAGSPLTSLSLLGPNPGLGVRFFGIGNELESTIGALLMLGAGAAVTALAPADPRRTVAIVAGVVTLVAVLVFAPGRFGADVGAAITFPAGGAAVIIAALGLPRSKAVLVIAAPIVALIALVAIDLVLGGDAHLSRSVLAAGGLEELGNVFERRIRLGAGSFPRYLESPYFILALVAIVIGVVNRRRIIEWTAGRPAVAAGLVGAIAATLIGTLANDSAALLLMVGTAFIAAFCGLTWAASGSADP